MSDTNDTSDDVINKKKTNKDNIWSNIISFLTSLIVIFIVILLYFASGSLILFLCKLAQSNILPTDNNCFPYTDNLPNIKEIQTNIFPTIVDNKEMSMKLQIPYDDKNKKNILLDILNKYKNKPSSFFLANYFISIIESLIQFDYSSINVVLNILNGMPEPIIIGFGPFISSFLFSFGVLINGLYFIYLWFSNMYWFFKTNTNKSNEGKPIWEDVTLITPINLFLAICLIIIFTIIFFVGFPIISFIPFCVLFYTIFSSLFYKGIFNGNSINAFSLISSVLKYYKITFVNIISIFVVLLSFSKLGKISGIVSLFLISLIYWRILCADIFNPITETNLSPIVSYEQAKKICIPEKKYLEKHGFLYNLLFSQKGGNISRELKNLHKQLS